MDTATGAASSRGRPSSPTATKVNSASVTLIALALAQYPDLDAEGDRCPAGALDLRVATDRVADMHGLEKGDVRD
jgi:hypothetical protein